MNTSKPKGQPLNNWNISQILREFIWIAVPIFHWTIAIHHQYKFENFPAQNRFNWTVGWIMFASMVWVISILAVGYEKKQSFLHLPSTYDKNQSGKPLGVIITVITGIILIACYTTIGLIFCILVLALAFLTSPRSGWLYPYQNIKPIIPNNRQFYLALPVALVGLFLSIIYNIETVLPAFLYSIILYGLVIQLLSPFHGEKPKAVPQKPVVPPPAIWLSGPMKNRISHLLTLASTNPEKVSALLESLRIAHPLEAGPQFQAILQKLPKHNALDTFERRISLEYLWETAENDLNQKKSAFGPQKYHAQFHYCHHCNSKVSRRTFNNVDYVECPKCLKCDHLFSNTTWIIGTPDVQKPTQNGTTLFIPIWNPQSQQFLPAEVDQVDIPITYESAAEWMISAMFHHFAEKHPNMKGTINLNLAPGLHLTENARRMVNAGIKAKYWRLKTA